MGSRIWPGPECLTSRPVDPGDFVRVIGCGFLSSGVVTRRARHMSTVYVRGATERGTAEEHAFYPESLRRHDTEAEHRTRAIGEGRAKAAGRMRRFLAWLEEVSGSHSLQLVRSSMSPEHAVLRDPASCRVYRAVGERWVSQWVAAVPSYWELEELAREFIASPEWASLPWQREGVGCG